MDKKKNSSKKPGIIGKIPNFAEGGLAGKLQGLSPSVSSGPKPGKPKKRKTIVFAEAPEKISRWKYTYDEVDKNGKVILNDPNTPKKYADLLQAIADFEEQYKMDVGEVSGGSVEVDDPEIKELADAIGKGIDEMPKQEIKKQDDTFIKEANNVKEFYKKKDPNMEVEVVPLYGDKKKFQEKLSKLNEDDNILMFGHSGDRLFGIDNKELSEELNKTKAKNCYFGSCNFDEYIDDYKTSGKNVTFRKDDVWLGFNPAVGNLEEGLYSRVVDKKAIEAAVLTNGGTDSDVEGLNKAKISKNKKEQSYDSIDFSDPKNVASAQLKQIEKDKAAGILSPLETLPIKTGEIMKKKKGGYAGVIGKFEGGGFPNMTPETIAFLNKIYAQQGQPQTAVDPLNPLPTQPIQPLPQQPLNDPQALQQAQDLGDQQGVKQNLGNVGRQVLDNSRGLLGLAGGLETGLANAPGFAPDPTQGAIGGALSGVSAGAALGPLGALVGGIGGGLLGYASTADKRGQYESLKLMKEKQRVKDRTVDPYLGVMYAEEGGLLEDLELTPVQTEVGEVVLLPNGTLSDTKAKLTHEEMDKDDVTDVLPVGAFIFSNSDKKLNLSDKLKDTVMGYGLAQYNEFDDNEVKTVKFGDILTNKVKDEKEITFAELAKSIRETFSTKPENKDIFSNITNVENLKGRLPFLKKSMKLQEEKMGDSKLESLQTMKYGGHVKKYPEGGPITMEDLMKQYQDFLNESKTNNELEKNSGLAEYGSLKNKLTNINILGNGVVKPLFSMLQSPYVQPAYEGTNLAGAMFRSGSEQGVNAIANNNMGSVNSLAGQLLAQGYNPTEVNNYTASARNQATGINNDLRLKNLLKNEQLDRDKYTFLNAVRNNNEKADANALNTSIDNQNKQISQVGEGLTNGLTQQAKIETDSTDSSRQLMKDYIQNKYKIGGLEVGLKGNMYALQSKQDEINKGLLQDLPSNTPTTPADQTSQPTQNNIYGNTQNPNDSRYQEVLNGIQSQNPIFVRDFQNYINQNGVGIKVDGNLSSIPPNVMDQYLQEYLKQQ